MATWREMGKANARAAAMLARDETVCRASVSRAYYAVYQEVTHQIIESGDGQFGRFNNPTHEVLARLVRNNLSSISGFRKRELERLIRRLRQRRVDADYRPKISVDRASVHGALRDMCEARRLLGVSV